MVVVATWWVGMGWGAAFGLSFFVLGVSLRVERVRALPLLHLSVTGGPFVMPRGHLLLIVGTDGLEVERALSAGGLGCPGCGGRLRPWGFGRWRVVRCRGVVERRRPRRSRCGVCAVTHVLISTDTRLRRRDEVGVIGAALVAKAAGVGHRVVAVLAGVPVSTARGWLRRFAANAEQVDTSPCHQARPPSQKTRLYRDKEPTTRTPQTTLATTPPLRDNSGDSPAGKLRQPTPPPAGFRRR